jgi:hypothetical protein
MKVKLPKKLEDIERGFVLLPKSVYHVRVVGVKMKQGPNENYLQWSLVVFDNEDWDGAIIPYVTPVAVQSLWKLVNLEVACEVEPIGDVLETDLLMDRDLWVTTTQEEYPKNTGTFRTKVAACHKADPRGEQGTPSWDSTDADTPEEAEKDDLPF